MRIQQRALMMTALAAIAVAVAACSPAYEESGGETTSLPESSGVPIQAISDSAPHTDER